MTVPTGWAPNFDAFLEGVQLGVYIGLAALFALIVITAVRRVLGV